MSEHDTKSNALATRLRLAREQAGLSQGQVAKMLGLHRPSISEAEAGRRKVSSEECAELARIYDVDVAWLVSGEADQAEDRVALAARELAKLQPADLDRLLNLLGTLRTQKDSDL